MSNLAENVRARQAAQELVNSAGNLHSDRFWEVVIELAKAKLSPTAVATEDAPMDDREAAQFEKMMMPYGAYKDYPIGEIPCNYFCSITESPFSKKLRRYVCSKTFKERQDD